MAHQRFAQEARYAAAIRHEHVVTVFAVSALEGIPFLVMEYVAGRSLQDWIDQGLPFSIDEVIRIGHQTALGLSAAHGLRLVHRDVKPANILLEDRTGSVRITDFGLARAMDSDAELSQQGLLLGTPLYMSPEQVDGKPVGPASDLFSLGSVLYTLCTGKHPFACSSLLVTARLMTRTFGLQARRVSEGAPGPSACTFADPSGLCTHACVINSAVVSNRFVAGHRGVDACACSQPKSEHSRWIGQAHRPTLGQKPRRPSDPAAAAAEHLRRDVAMDGFA